MTTKQEQWQKAFERYGAFFAFSHRQYKQNAQPGTKYTRIAPYIVCPEICADQLDKELRRINRC